MAKKKSAQFKRFASAMSKIVTVSKDELAKREAAYQRQRPPRKVEPAPGDMFGDTVVPRPADSE